MPAMRPDMSFEAAWNEDGAVCVAHPRIPENITLAEIATRFDLSQAGSARFSAPKTPCGLRPTRISVQSLRRRPSELTDSNVAGRCLPQERISPTEAFVNPGRHAMYGISIFDLSWLAVSMLAAGAVTGLLAGVFGVGGGAVAVPILYELFRMVGVPEEVRMPLCVGTSLAIIIPTSIRSFTAHRAKGAVDMSILRVWAIPVVVGVIMGSFIARYAPADLFKTVFVLVAGVSAIRLLFGKDTWRLGLDMPARPIMIVYGWVIGVSVGADGNRRRAAFEPVHDLLQPLDPSGGGDILGPRHPHLDPRRAGLHLCRVAARGASIPTWSRCNSRWPSATSRCSGSCCSCPPAHGWRPSARAWPIACRSAGLKSRSVSSW